MISRRVGEMAERARTAGAACRFLGMAVLMVALWMARAPHAESVPSRPHLVVFVVVDQMRADYVDRFRSDWTGGFKRIVADGAWFRRAAYPYLTTVTCAGHATVATGAFPHRHGIIQNAWWDRDRQAMVTCTDDDAAKNVGYGRPAPGGDSGHQLAIPTLPDVMRTERGAMVVTLSLKARSAIMLAGHGGEATWLNDDLSGWATSTAFGNGVTVPAVNAYVRAHAIDDDFGKTWDRLLPPNRYGERDDAVGEAPPPPWMRTFPHVLRSRGNQPDAEFHTLWERSPFADQYVARLAAALVEDRQLGRHQTTDFLGVSFSTPDLVGHAFGPSSQEIHDIYLQLDRTLGFLFNRLDALVGRANYLVALTADHGVTEIPEQLLSHRKDGGRLDPAALAALIDARAQKALGPGTYVASVNGNDVYFRPGMYDRLSASRGALDAMIGFLRGVPGIRDVFTREEVRHGTTSTNPALRASALTYFQGRSGDLILVPKGGWMFAPAGTTHGTASDDDQRVPVFLSGSGIKTGAYDSPATPADIAPTIAAMLGIRLPDAEGHPLTPGLLPSQSTH